MAQLPRDIVDNLTFKLNILSNAAKKAIADQIAMIQYDSVADLRNKLIEILEPYFANATDLAAEYAAQMYNDAREYALGKRLDAIADSGRIPEATQGAIRSFVGELQNGGLERIVKLLQERIDYEIKRAAGYATSDLAMKDPAKPRFARVPTGAETCQFCIMLASRGFVYHTKKSAGALDHWHPNCDCRIVPGFQGYTKIKGYDPDELYRLWKGSGFNPNTPEKRRTKYTYKSTDDNIPSFQNFNDVKQYLYDATSQEDLEHRFSILGNIYGYQSEQMTSQALKNVVKTASHKFE